MSAESATASAVRATASRQRRTTLLLLRLLALSCFLVGAFALGAPHNFYRRVLGVHLLGPYNEHLISDVGGFYLGFALVFAMATRKPSREVVRASCAGFALTQGAHFLWHALNLQPFTFAEGAVQTVLLALFLALPLTTLYLSERGGTDCKSLNGSFSDDAPGGPEGRRDRRNRRHPARAIR